MIPNILYIFKLLRVLDKKVEILAENGLFDSNYTLYLKNLSLLDQFSSKHIYLTADFAAKRPSVNDPEENL